MIRVRYKSALVLTLHSASESTYLQYLSAYMCTLCLWCALKVSNAPVSDAQKYADVIKPIFQILQYTPVINERTAAAVQNMATTFLGKQGEEAVSSGKQGRLLISCIHTYTHVYIMHVWLCVYCLCVSRLAPAPSV